MQHINLLVENENPSPVCIWNFNIFKGFILRDIHQSLLASSESLGVGATLDTTVLPVRFIFLQCHLYTRHAARMSFSASSSYYTLPHSTNVITSSNVYISLPSASCHRRLTFRSLRGYLRVLPLIVFQCSWSFNFPKVSLFQDLNWNVNTWTWAEQASTHTDKTDKRTHTDADN